MFLIITEIYLLLFRTHVTITKKTAFGGLFYFTLITESFHRKEILRVDFIIPHFLEYLLR